MEKTIQDKTEQWQPPADATVWIVCAACIKDGFIAVGPRHFDPTMREIIQYYGFAKNIPANELWHNWEQGFIDQWGRYYNREEAMKIVLENGQRFDKERNGGSGEDLYSEGLY